MEGHTGRLREGLEPFLEEFGIHLAELWPGEADLPDQVGAVRGVEADPGQGLVHRDDGVSVARDAGTVRERPRYGLAHDITGVFGRVMEVDVQIAIGVQRQVDQAVSRELLEHVIEKTDAGRDLCGTGAVEIDPAGDSGFFGIAFDGGDPHDTLLERRTCGGVLLTTSTSGFHNRALGVPSLTPDPPNLHLSFLRNCVRLSFSRVPFAQHRIPKRRMDHSADTVWHGTTILCLRKASQVVVAGDGQVTMGQTVVKSNARKLRRLAGGSVIAGI